MIVMDPGHILATLDQLLPSGWRYRMPMASTARARRSFIPRSIQAVQAVNGQQLVSTSNLVSFKSVACSFCNMED